MLPGLVEVVELVTAGPVAPAIARPIFPSHLAL